MMNVELIIDQLESWQRGYLPPSAQILMDDARKLIIEQARELDALREELDALKTNHVAEVKKTARKSKVKDNE